jgi:hypothetical protein
MIDGEQPLSIAAAARQVGVSRQTLWTQVQSGAVRSHDGRVYMSEVKDDRRRNVDTARAPMMGSTRRGRAQKDHIDDMADRLEALESEEWLVMDALAHSDADPVHLDFFETTVSRADARGLIAAYREVNRALFLRRESGKRELAAISALHRRLGVQA